MKIMFKGADVRYIPDSNVDLYKSKGYAVKGEIPKQNLPPIDGQTDGNDNAQDENEGTGDTDADKLVCPFCGKKYASQATLDRHIKEKHSQE